jgi:hypothetical protein
MFIEVDPSRSEQAIQEARSYFSLIEQRARVEPLGSAIFDSLVSTADRLGSAGKSSKALLVLTDGADLSSERSLKDTKEFLKAFDLQVFAVGQQLPADLGFDRVVLEFCHWSGGRCIFPRDLDRLDDILDSIHTELQSQYVLGWVPPPSKGPKDWRKVKIKLVNLPAGTPKLKVHTRPGYYRR